MSDKTLNVGALYTERLLDHARNSRRRGELSLPCAVGKASNRLCGDEVAIGLRVDSDRVVAFGFEADACAMTLASSSMLGEAALTHPVAGVIALADAFGDWLNRDDGGPPADIIRRADFDAFAELKKLPSRRRCALLPFEAFSAALQQIEMDDTEHDRG
ncbi:MAG TPA: iron-sulfur cluster assembly scaffold protein [Xanthomonadaceae bacterium]|nr:iron-sulfur cluster assembly scaffold protein [Xanthomonadaceae bacterium]